MTEEHDELMQRLSSLDPAAVDSPPAVGSDRFNSMKDSIMNATTKPTTSQTPTPQPRRSPRKLYLPLAAAAAVVAAMVVGVLLVGPGATDKAEAAVRTAAENTGDATSFRLLLEADGNAIVPGGRAEGEVAGDRLHLVAGELEFFRIGNTEWLGQDGSFESSTAEEQFTHFGEASEAVITAALASQDVSDQGVTALNGVDTRHYVIGVDDAARAALSQVPSQAQVWFVGNTEEEIAVEGNDEEARRFGFLEDADSISIWLADGLIHRISVDSGSSQFTYTFFDFGAAITIEPPA